MGYSVLTYGSYSHAAGEAKLDGINRQTTFDERGGKDRRVEIWNVSGLLTASSQSALTSAMEAMQAAYAVHNVDVAFKPDGSSTGAHYMTAAAALQGPRCSSFSWGNQVESEYSVHRSYSLTIEGVFEYEGAADNISFSESVQVAGGGPRKQLVEFISGPPQEFALCEKTIITATQSGRAVGRDTYPIPPEPLWPANEDLNRRSITQDSPTRNESDSIKYFGINWSYTFNFTEWPEGGTPHTWL